MTALPQGFTAAGIACGLKPSGGLDIAMLVSDRPAVSAGVFTTNRVQAAPLVLTKRHVRRGIARAIVANAGNANACTGKQGTADARAMAEVSARALGIKGREKILVASTGIIGVPMPMDTTHAGIQKVAKTLSSDGFDDLARAIMTTDTKPKIAEATVGGARIVGVAKGAGMIAPEMATMLSFIATDAALERGELFTALRSAADDSFNAISVDGCMSTNDCVLALANGAAGEVDSDAFAKAIAEVSASLARQIVEDGEGATKVVTIRVTGATKLKEARTAASTIANSVLLRCALNGADPNWGRVLAALGTSGIPFDPNRVDVWLGGEKLCENGARGPGHLDRAAAALQKREVELVIDMQRGAATATILTNDLSAEYVRINADYTT